MPSKPFPAAAKSRSPSLSASAHANDPSVKPGMVPLDWKTKFGEPGRLFRYTDVALPNWSPDATKSGRPSLFQSNTASAGDLTPVKFELASRANEAPFPR